jgi:hypothetical protein
MIQKYEPSSHVYKNVLGITVFSILSMHMTSVFMYHPPVFLSDSRIKNGLKMQNSITAGDKAY